MTIDEALKTLRYEIDEECHCNYIADEIRTLIDEVDENHLKLIESRREINRQKAEIERLKGWESLLKAEKHSLIKAEAIKAFAKEIHLEIEKALTNNYEVRGKRMANLGVAGTDEFVSHCTGKIYALRGIDEFIDNLVKEMVGDNNG